MTYQNNYKNPILVERPTQPVPPQEEPEPVVLQADYAELELRVLATYLHELLQTVVIIF